MLPYRPSRILIQEQSGRDALTGEILSRLPGVPVTTVLDVEGLPPEAQRVAAPGGCNKQTLILARHRGSFMKECPGSGAEICCNYYVVNFAYNCHLECTYCILQTYLNSPAMVVFTNVEDLVREVEEKLSAEPDAFFRIGTGEMADSLALDDITCYSRILVPFFGRLPNGILELKTKSDRIANLEGLDHRGRTVVSWSLNPAAVIRSDELKTATLQERLSAARKCHEWGYRLGFHFDPMIHYQGWERDYEETVRELFAAVEPGSVAWISLGALRFTPHLRDLLKERFPKSKIPYGEFVPGHHGKLRYFRPVREEMYSKMLGWIRREAPGVFVYLCMESRAVWERSFGNDPRATSDLSNRLDALVCSSCHCTRSDEVPDEQEQEPLT
jgi:spore photoproduct lyase